MSAVTTHVLDTARGVPAAGVPVRLERVAGTGRTEIARTRTGPDGRASGLGPRTLPPGTYRLVFDTAEYFASLNQGSEGGAGEGRGSRGPFFPEVTVTFTTDTAGTAGTADGGAARYHVPLLLSPFGYATYRGS